MQQPAQIALLDGGRRLHLHHGPIDLVIGADPGEGAGAEARARAFRAAAGRFEGLLEGLARELEHHRQALRPATPLPDDPVARRMYMAARPFCAAHFLTPMIAVAGAVADEVLAAMCAAGPLARAYVNNGGDIALHLAPGQEFSVAMATHGGADLGRVRVGAHSGVGGVATSGARGRSLSLGIAESVTVLARTAALADTAATLIANAVDLPDHPGITRVPAAVLRPESDLGQALVATHVPALSPAERAAALAAGCARARALEARGHILGAALFLQGDAALTGGARRHFSPLQEVEHA